jgi:hypothetical protein
LPEFGTTKRAKGGSSKRSLSWPAWLGIVLGIVAVIVVVTRVHPLSQPSSDSRSELRAAIVDQLYSTYPNEDFTTEVVGRLENYGFMVDVYRGEEVTVDFYRNLPVHNHKLIVFRTHSGAMRPPLQDVEAIKGVYLFTNEPYTKMKYPKEQLNDELVKARVVDDSPDFFAIGERFITSSMRGSFDGTVVIIDGCSCLYNTDLAKAFVSRGVSCYIAWDVTVDLDYVDRATMSLVNHLCTARPDEMTLGQSIERTILDVGPDLKYNSVLKYYPPQSGPKTLGELIG